MIVIFYVFYFIFYVNYVGTKARVKSRGDCSKQEKISYDHG